MTRKRDEYTDRKRLQDAGWKVRKHDSVAFNAGSETLRHASCKFYAAWALHEQGYRVDSEVVHEERGELDVLGYANGRIVGVECETSPREDVIQDKLDRYFRGTPLDEIYVLNVSEMPQGEIHDILEWVQGHL